MIYPEIVYDAAEEKNSNQIMTAISQDDNLPESGEDLMTNQDQDKKIFRRQSKINFPEISVEGDHVLKCLKLSTKKFCSESKIMRSNIIIRKHTSGGNN